MTGRPPRGARPNRPAEQSEAVVELRFHGDLNDYLPVALRDATMRRHVLGRPAVKDVVEAAGVPHPEIALVLVNDAPVGFDRRLEPGDRVDAFPAGWTEPGRPIADLAGEPSAGDDRFVLDGHLGRLAAYLRMCGFDTAYRRDAGDDELARLADAEDRILLTRDVGLLKRSVVRRGAFVRSEHPPDQLVEILRRFELAGRLRPFERCLRCNGCLEPVARESVEGQVPPRVYREQAAFSRCPDCHGVYWRGSHHARMSRLLARTLDAAGPRVAGLDGTRPGVARPDEGGRPESPRAGRLPR